jgi:hypothetical protein
MEPGYQIIVGENKQTFQATKNDLCQCKIAVNF